jgi:hypothetical protein
MTIERLMPFLMICLSLIAGIVYGITGDYKRCAYWFAAAVLNASVTI